MLKAPILSENIRQPKMNILKINIRAGAGTETCNMNK